MTMSVSKAADVLVSALLLAAERVTGDDPEAKRARRVALRQAADGVETMARVAEHPITASQLRELLGDPDSSEVRQALDTWTRKAETAPAPEGASG